MTADTLLEQAAALAQAQHAEIADLRKKLEEARAAAIRECATVAHEAHLRYATIRDQLRPEQGTQRFAAEQNTKTAAAIWGTRS